MASTCCPIEMEPRTLREGQLNHAREVAVDVIQKMEPNKATAIFTEGLKLINPRKDKQQSAEDGKEVDSEPIKIESQKQGVKCIEKPCECSCASALSESPDQLKLKEPLSAPF